MSGGIYSSKSNNSYDDEEDESADDVRGGSPRRREPATSGHDQVSFHPNAKSGNGSPEKRQASARQDENREYNTIKHVFEVKVKELKNIPVLNKLIREQGMYDDNRKVMSTNSPSKKSERKASRD